MYHPRKCKGFGLSDGEGCERFWKAIKPLIPSCHVSGYYNQIYTIDTQVKHIDEQSLMGLGNWLRKKWISMGDKQSDALVVLEMVEEKGFSIEFLQTQWEEQVAEQTKPLKKQSKGIADKAINEILALTKNIDGYKEEIRELETMMEISEYPEGMDIFTVDESLVDLRSRLTKATNAVSNKRTKLGIDARLVLQRLIGNQFLRLRLNALAVKQRIRDRLRQRKFELENLERAYRTTVNQRKLSQHAEQQIKRKEPGIQTLARNYNKMCIELKELIAKKKAPRGAVAPLPMESAGLFRLDVDDDIWQDIGLTDETDSYEAIPPWLGDENVREGIKSLLQYRRCQEEEQRLISERISMQQWIREEWVVMLAALDFTQDHPDLQYQFELRKKYLIRLCLGWEPMVQAIPNKSGDTWGPSEEDLAWGRSLEFNESVLEKDEESEVEEWADEEEGEDAELVDEMEARAWADQF